MSIRVYIDILQQDYDFCTEKFDKTVYLSNDNENIKSQIGDELKSQGIRQAFVMTHDTEISKFVIDVLQEKFMAG